jgi:Holliday junction resolvase
MGLIIQKASGERVAFEPNKLRHSLQKAGATPGLVDEIVRKVEKRFTEEVSTKKIYRMAFSLLKVHSNQLAGKYHLKRAIMELGPTGYPFERYIGEILKVQGYQTQVGVIVQGKCVTHEVDVIAEKEDHHFMIECKFHNQPGTKSDVKVALYIRSRFEDVRNQWIHMPGHKAKFHQGWVVTNTKFTQDAIDYGKCSGMSLLGWDYPANGSLNERINLSGLHPLTCITSLTKKEKSVLLGQSIVLCREICERPEVLSVLELSIKRTKKILEEAQGICMDDN